MKGEHLQPQEGGGTNEQKLDPRTPEALLEVINRATDQEIVELDHYLNVAQSMVRLNREQGSEPSERDRRLNEIGDTIDYAYSRLVEQDADRARTLFSALARSSDQHSRIRAGLQIYGLAKAGNRDFAVNELERLVRDSDGRVRRVVYAPIDGTGLADFYSDMSPGEQAKYKQMTKESVESHGLTLKDAWRLHHAYQEAEAGHNLVDPQRELFDRIVGRLYED